MEALAFVGPDGEPNLNPTSEKLTNFLNMAPDYWVGSAGYIGWVTLRNQGYSTDFTRPTLHILLHEGYGVHLSYQVMSYKPLTSNLQLMICDETVTDDFPVELYLGAELAHYPRRSFVSREIALLIMADFLNAEKPSEKVAWKPMKQVDDRGFGYVDGGPHLAVG